MRILQEIEWKDVDEEDIGDESGLSSVLEGSTVEESDPDAFSLLVGETLQESFHDVRMQFRAMNLRRDGVLHVTNYRVAFVYVGVRQVSPSFVPACFPELSRRFFFAKIHFCYF